MLRSIIMKEQLYVALVAPILTHCTEEQINAAILICQDQRHECDAKLFLHDNPQWCVFLKISLVLLPMVFADYFGLFRTVHM